MEFHYQAANAQGQLLSGQLQAGDERAALRALQQQGLTPVALHVAQAAAPIAGGRERRISRQDKTLVLQELTTLLNAGVPLAESVESIASAHGASAVGPAFARALSALRQGERFSDALRAAAIELPDYVYQLVAAGELTGKLGESLHAAVTQMAYEDRVRQEMRNALTYPVILVVSGILAVLLVFIVVVPKFSGLLRGNTANVPLLSLWVIGAGMFVQAHLRELTAAALLLATALVGAARNPAVRARAYESLTRLPILGRWIIETEMGRWAAMLGALLENRVAIITGMELALGGVRLTKLRTSLQQVLRDVRGGVRFADALTTNRALEATGINLIRVGERSGELAPMLRALASLYENAGRDRMKRFLLLLEPLAILLIGTVIGVIMVAIMLAVTSMNDRVA